MEDVRMNQDTGAARAETAGTDTTDTRPSSTLREADKLMKDFLMPPENPENAAEA